MNTVDNTSRGVQTFTDRNRAARERLRGASMRVTKEDTLMQTEHSIRRPVAARRALEQRRKMLAVGILLALGIAGVLALLLVGCGGGSSMPVSPPPVATVEALQIADVEKIV